MTRKMTTSQKREVQRDRARAHGERWAELNRTKNQKRRAKQRAKKATSA